MAKKKLTIEEKREKARNHILEVSLELFYTKGFEETTTRDIITKAGILNGSLYNRFKNKDDILISIVKDVVKNILHDSEEILKNEKNLILAGSFPGALEIYVAYHSKPLAKLLYAAHGKWDAVLEYAQINLDWSEKLLTDYGYSEVDMGSFLMREISVIGSVGNIVGYYVNDGTLPYHVAIRDHITNISRVLNMPCMDADGLTNKLCQILDAQEFTVLGHNLREELPEFCQSE